MTTQQAINSIHAVKGTTSIIAGIMNNDYSVLPHDKGLGADLALAEQEVSIHQKRLDECKSDWAYWSILGDLEYWTAVKNILNAAALVGHDKLPDIPAPDLKGCVVMDAIGRVSDFGEAVLREAQAITHTQK
jgi:hypothetical protein